MTGTGLPLDGVRVVEMTHMVMGPTCGMILAQLGAEVIKVEPPAGDKTRSLGGMGTSFFPLFNRGKTHPGELPKEVEQLIGDRNGQLDALKGRKWDVAIDTCGYIPRIVKASAGLLANAVEHYTFISSLSVYKDFNIPNQDESAPLGMGNATHHRFPFLSARQREFLKVTVDVIGLVELRPYLLDRHCRPAIRLVDLITNFFGSRQHAL